MRRVCLKKKIRTSQKKENTDKRSRIEKSKKLEKRTRQKTEKQWLKKLKTKKRSVFLRSVLEEKVGAGCESRHRKAYYQMRAHCIKSDAK